MYMPDTLQKDGVVIDKLLIATNKNDILKRTMETGIYEKKDVVPSVAPSMDIQISSNFEDCCSIYARKFEDVCMLMMT